MVDGSHRGRRRLRPVGYSEVVTIGNGGLRRG